MIPRRPTRLPRWQEWSVYLSCGLLIATGIGWLVLDQWVRVAAEFGPEHHPAQRLTLIFHAIAAYVFLVVAGSIVPVHARVGWSLRRNRKSGLLLATICVVLAVSALGLYYLADEIARVWTSYIHWIVGLVCLPALLLHSVRGRRGA
jgi:hypothetical protein